MLILSCTDIAGFLLKTATLPLFNAKFVDIPLGLHYRSCGSAIIMQVIQPTRMTKVLHCHRQTDRQH